MRAIDQCCGPVGIGWSAEGWQVFFDERAGIAEFDSGLPRPQAEAQALACCVTEWLNHNHLVHHQDAVSAAVGRIVMILPTASNRSVTLGCAG
jgi:hypothetical protein